MRRACNFAGIARLLASCVAGCRTLAGNPRIMSGGTHERPIQDAASCALSRAGDAPIPVEPYLSQDYYDKEIEKIFRRDWLVVGREEEIAKPGDYKVKRLDFARTSVILIRGKDGKIGAFHNVCRHRGNKVVTETGGEETFGSSKAAVVTCRFHGWVYNAKGELVDVPQEEKFPACFDRAENGLIPIHVDTWAGFIFINLAETPPGR